MYHMLITLEHLVLSVWGILLLLSGPSPDER